MTDKVQNPTEDRDRREQLAKEDAERTAKENAAIRERLRPALAIECPACNMGIERPCSVSSESAGRWSVCGKRLAKSLGREDLYWLFDGRRVLRLPDELVVDRESISPLSGGPAVNVARRSVLPLNSGDLRVKVGDTIKVEDQPSGPYRPHRLFLSNAHEWDINDVTIGNHSQFEWGFGNHRREPLGPIPGELLSGSMSGHGVWLDDVDVGMKVAIIATRIAGIDGDVRTHGNAFIAGLLGFTRERRQLTETIPTE